MQPLGGDRLRAGRLFFERVEDQIRTRRSFVIEVTLAGRTFRRIVHQLRQSGYQISMAFVFLPDPEACIARIHERVQKGGHPIPAEDVIRRFSRSCNNFWNVYRPLADRWHLFYNGGFQVQEVAVGMEDTMTVLDETLLDLFLEIARQSRNG